MFAKTRYINVRKTDIKLHKKAPLNKTRCEIYTNSCYSIVANLDGIDMNDQDAKWSYAKRGCSSAFEQETETIFFKA